MNFLYKHYEWFRNIAIASSTTFNFFLIAACYTGEDGAWGAAFLIASIAVVSCIICQLCQNGIPNNLKRNEQN